MDNQKTQPLTPTLLSLILAMIALMQLSVDLYTPSFPSIQNSFATSLSQVQLSLSLFMLGFSCSHPIFGPWSDKIGRKNPLLLGIALNALGSLICLMSPSITILIFGRFLQGFGIGSCNSVGRSLARDLLNANRLAQVGAQIGMVSVLFLALSPTLGGYLQNYFGWRSNFAFLLIIALFLLVAAWFFLPETNKNPDPNATQLESMRRNYKLLLSSHLFVGYTLCACFAGAGIVAYLVIAPFLIQHMFGLSPIEFGWLAFIMAGGIFFSGVLNHFFVMVKGIKYMVFAGCLVMLSAGLIMLTCVFLNAVSLYNFMFCIALFCVGGGLTFMNAFAGAFDPFPHIAGTTGALYGFMQDLTAALVSSFIAWLSLTEPLTLAWALTILALLSLASYWYLISLPHAVLNASQCLEKNNKGTE